MPEILLFLGAGASRAFGVPTMREFVDEIGKQISGTNTPAQTRFVDIRSRLKRLYGEDVDLEKILDVAHELSLGRKSLEVLKALAPDAAIRTQELLERLPQSVQSLNEIDYQIEAGRDSAGVVEAEAIACINRLCAEANFEESRKAYRELFSQFTSLGGIKDADGHPLNPESVTSGRAERFRAAVVVTTNYDNIFEDFCSVSEIRWDSGFQPSQADQEATFQGPPQWNGQVLPILKLHGSIDWWRTSTNRVIRRPNGQVGQRVLGGSRITQSEIRYPVGSKELFGDPYLRLYSRFAEFLSSTPIWIFIGYSFADPSVRQLVRESIRTRTKMYVIHPHASDLERGRLARMGSGRVYYVPERFPTPASFQAVRNTLGQ